MDAEPGVDAIKLDAGSAGREQEEASSLRRLQEEHRRYSQELESLSSKPYLSEDEKLEQVRLKKLKLRIKDRMYGLPASSPQLR